MKDNFFTPLENTRPFLKAAFQGFPKSGKTYTASALAIGLHKYIKSEKPIVTFDTEESFKALKPKFDEAKISVLTKQSRTLADLNETIKFCNDGGADILIIDSITHVYENFLEAYKVKFRRDRLYFQDWGIVKPKWKAEFADAFVRAKCHILFTGRAGYEYEEEKNEDTGKKEVTKSGVRMKAETETAYEPDLLIMMERIQNTIGNDRKAHREAFILGDRTDVIDGKTFINPSFKDFEPAVKIYLMGKVNDTERNETPDTFETRENGEAYRERETKEVEMEKLGEIYAKYGYSGSMGKDDKKMAVAVLEKVFECTARAEVATKYNAFQIKKRNEVLDKVLSGLVDIGDIDGKKEYLKNLNIDDLYAVEAETAMTL